MKLYAVQLREGGRRSWCGPTALAAISGRSVEACTRVLRQVTGKRCIMGVRGFEMDMALGALGFRVASRQALGIMEGQKRPTLAAWLRQPRPAGRVHLIALTDHYVVVAGRRFVDNRQPEPVPTGQAWCRRCRVRNVKVIEPKGA